MSTAKHTPGPWINQDMLITAGPDHNNFGRICEVSMDDSEFDLETTKANAKLIAAAPEMLEALDALATDLRNAANGHGLGNLDTMASLAERAISFRKQ